MDTLSIALAITLNRDGSGWVEEVGFDGKIVGKDDHEVMEILALFVMTLREEVEAAVHCH